MSDQQQWDNLPVWVMDLLESLDRARLPQDLLERRSQCWALALAGPSDKWPPIKIKFDLQFPQGVRETRMRSLWQQARNASRTAMQHGLFRKGSATPWAEEDTRLELLKQQETQVWGMPRDYTEFQRAIEFLHAELCPTNTPFD